MAMACHPNFISQHLSPSTKPFSDVNDRKQTQLVCNISRCNGLDRTRKIPVSPYSGVRTLLFIVKSGSVPSIKTPKCLKPQLHASSVYSMKYKGTSQKKSSQSIVEDCADLHRQNYSNITPRCLSEHFSCWNMSKSELTILSHAFQNSYEPTTSQPLQHDCHSFFSFT